MRKFSWQTMIIFVIVLLLGVVLIGLGTAYVIKLKQQRRQLSDNCPSIATSGGGARAAFAQPIARARCEITSRQAAEILLVPKVGASTFYTTLSIVRRV
jgi:hypothetical protein